jgi:hypothetical protein
VTGAENFLSTSTMIEENKTSWELQNKTHACGEKGNLYISEYISTLEDDDMMPLLCLKMKYHYPMTQHHIPLEWNPLLYHCKKTSKLINKRVHSTYYLTWNQNVLCAAQLRIYVRYHK